MYHQKANIEEKIISLEHNEGFCGITCFKARIEKKKSEIEESKLLATGYKHMSEIDKITLDIFKIWKSN
ncbi:MAG: hypothetical protein LBB92_01055 [Endomicrobium sp.]|nr:hypothetical protein [Endomicrobium sp.]